MTLYNVFLVFIFLVVSGQAILLPRNAYVRQLRQNLTYPYDSKDRLDKLDSFRPVEQIQYKFYFPFFGDNFNFTHVSINGVIGFGGSLFVRDFPAKFPKDDWPRQSDPPFIAPFYGQAQLGEDNGVNPPGVYIRSYSNIGYGLGVINDLQEQIDLKEAIKQDIQEGMIGSTDFIPKHVIIVTWKNVTFGGSRRLEITNTFQVVIVTDEIRTYVMFNYEKIRWTSSATSGGTIDGTSDGTGGYSAFVGFNGGNGTRAFEYHPYSQTRKIINLLRHGYINGFPGRHMFRVDEEIIQGTCNFDPDYRPIPTLSISPESGHMLGGTIINVTGPCLSNNRLQLKVHDTEVRCLNLSRYMATCVTPTTFTAGFVDVTTKTQSLGPFSNKFYIENPMMSSNPVKIENPHILNKPYSADILEIRWPFSNITWNKNHPVFINLYGYKETRTKLQIIFIRTLAESIPNSGYYKIDLKKFHNVNDGSKRELTFGFIQINATLYKNPQLTPALWSKPIPLGWYFQNQWVQYFGNNWAEKFCSEWDLEQSYLKPLANNLPECPCTSDQASVDKSRFIPDPNCDIFGNNDCYGNQKIIQCFILSQSPFYSGGGQSCCYGVDGDLVMNADMKEAGTLQRAHPFGTYPYDEPTKVPALSHWYHDYMPYQYCCNWQSESNSSCYDIFKEKRKSQDCIGYQPSNVSTVHGDPHFITFDNLEYTFNGQGEFALLHSEDHSNWFNVQGRFGPLYKKSQIILNATIITSIAAKENISDTIEIQRRAPGSWRYKLEVLVNGKNVYFDRLFKKIQIYKGVTVYCPGNIYNQSHVIAVFQNGASVEVIEHYGYLAARVYLPKSFMNLTRGLLGNWSNNATDDLALPPQMFRPPVTNLSLASIHHNFGMNWMVNETSRPLTLFHHDNHRSSSHYNNKTFLPDFNTEPKLQPSSPLNQNDINNVCGSEKQCRYDYIISEDKKLAQATMFYYGNFYNLRNRLRKISTCPYLKTPRYGRKSTNKYLIHTLVKFECESGYVLVGNSSRVCQQDGHWSGNGTTTCEKI